MSQCNKEIVVCPKCKGEGKMEIWSSVNADLNPELRDKIMDDSLFLWTCPHCGEKIFVPFGTIYHDMTNRFMLFFDHNDNSEEPYEPLELPQESLGVGLKDYKLRVVHGLGNLKEKMVIMGALGLDDVAIEHMKFMISHVVLPEIAAHGYELRISGYEPKNEVSEYGAIFFSYNDEEKQQTMQIRFAMDNYYEHKCAVDLDPRMQFNGGMCVDQGWMAKQLMAVGEPSRKTFDVGDRGEYVKESAKWRLVDANDKALTQDKYWFIEKAGEGYFRAQVTGGSEYNILRPDGSELLSQTFSMIHDVHNGIFSFHRTQRKTKTTPTKWLCGLGHISGVILFPPMFDFIKWLDEEKKTAYYAELEGKPYILTTDGTIYDPTRSHLPKKLIIDNEAFMEKVANWTFPGLQFFYKDTDAPIDAVNIYQVGKVFHAGTFFDVTTLLLKPIHKTRFLIASAHAAMICENDDLVKLQPQFGEWNMCTFHFNSYFKVMDVYQKNGVTQVFLLHIPFGAALIMGDDPLNINFKMEGDLNLVEKARASLDDKMQYADVHPLSKNKEFVDRMFCPVGLDNDFEPFPMELRPEPEDERELNFSNLIHTLANDADIDGYIEEDDNFHWIGIPGTICEGCIFNKNVNGKGDGCGRLAKESFRQSYLRGRCDHKKVEGQEYSRSEEKTLEEAQKAQEKRDKVEDTFALALIRDFLRDELSNDIDRLKDYDFRDLFERGKNSANLNKYTESNFGGGSSVFTMPIIQSIASLVFSKAWGGINVQGMCDRKYSIDPLYPLIMLFGSAIAPELDNGYFKGLEKWSLIGSHNNRVKKFWKLYTTVGNLFVEPWGIAISTIDIALPKAQRAWRRYPDALVAEFHKAFTGEKKYSNHLLSEIKGKKTKDLYDGYNSIEGFQRMVKDLMLESFIDENGSPKKLFTNITCSDKDLQLETYIEAIETYLDICEKEIPMRAERIVAELREILEEN